MKILSLMLCLLVALAIAPTRAQAQTCSAAMSAVNFGNVSPITSAAVNTTGTLVVSCSWNAVNLAPTAMVCVNLKPIAPRYLTNANNDMLRYDLYQDSAHSLSWGATTAGTTPISVSLTQPAYGTMASASISVYGQIGASQPATPVINNGSTAYGHTFSAGETSVNYSYYILGALGPPNCASISANGAFTFAVSASVVDNCNISATNVAFPASGLLTSQINATGTITVQCTAGGAYQVSLSSGASGTMGARTMLRSGGGTVTYQLYTDSARTRVWGDGSGGTLTATGVGTGASTNLTVYGAVPAQTTPAPGNYSDTITATISF